MLGPDKSKPQIIEELSREVSAFANTEGGVLVIGVDTGRDAEKAMAITLSEGVDANLRKPEWLQQVVASNISPPLNGLIVRPIRLSGTRAGKLAYVIEVPKGETAHQAHDLKYYGRYELESKPLPDNEIRLRMNRGRAAHAIIELASLDTLSANEEFSRRQSELQELKKAEEREREEAKREGDFVFIPAARRKVLDERKARLRAPKRDFNECTMELSLKNDGPITIRDCNLLVTIRSESQVTYSPVPHDGKWLFHFHPDSVLRKSSALRGMPQESVPARGRKLFPQQAMPFPNAKLTMRLPVGATPKECTLHWVLYLEDAPPVSGNIDLGRVLITQGCLEGRTKRDRGGVRRR